MSRSGLTERSVNGKRVTDLVIEAQDGAVVVIEVVWTDNQDARDVVDLAYEKAKRAVSRNTGEAEGSSHAEPGSGRDEAEWEFDLPHA